MFNSSHGQMKSNLVIASQSVTEFQIPVQELKRMNEKTEAEPTGQGNEIRGILKYDALRFFIPSFCSFCLNVSEVWNCWNHLKLNLKKQRRRYTHWRFVASFQSLIHFDWVFFLLYLLCSRFISFVSSSICRRKKNRISRTADLNEIELECLNWIESDTPFFLFLSWFERLSYFVFGKLNLSP